MAFRCADRGPWPIGLSIGLSIAYCNSVNQLQGDSTCYSRPCLGLALDAPQDHRPAWLLLLISYADDPPMATRIGQPINQDNPRAAAAAGPAAGAPARAMRVLFKSDPAKTGPAGPFWGNRGLQCPRKRLLVGFSHGRYLPNQGPLSSPWPLHGHLQSCPQRAHCKLRYHIV